MTQPRELGKSPRLFGKLAPLLVLAMIGGAPPAFAQANEPYLGQIEVFAFSFCPSGWASLDGQLLPISQYAALYNLLGTTYGGNRTTNFALPQAKPIFTATGAKLTQCIALNGVYPSQN